MDINSVISQMTLEQKAAFTMGADVWHTVEFGDLDVKTIMMSDGPHGLRKQENKGDELGTLASIDAVCFPAACATACSFNTELLYKMGSALAKECQAVGVDVLLGPGINIKRSPLGGRSFEYFSEDPVVAAELGGAFVDGCQSGGVGTSLKHFALNSQETQRLTSSSEVDKRTMYELYLYAFEQIVKKSQPWTIMSSYNRINGTYASENEWLLTEVLRDKWGFEGIVVSDWGAVGDRADAVRAGCDLEMPYTGPVSIKRVIDAVNSGELDEKYLDDCVRRMLELVEKCVSSRKGGEFDMEGDHRIAKEVADECIVLLKNEDNILPLQKDAKVALIGKFAKEPRYQGGGSSNVHSFKVSALYDFMESDCYADGYSDDPFEINERLIGEAVEAAKRTDVAVVCVGLPLAFESEGADRKDLSLPASHNALVKAVAAANPNTVVVLHNGAPVEMPWLCDVKGLVEAYLGGQAIGESVADVLAGKVNPSGKLAETFPCRLEDTPAYIEFGGKFDKTYYREGIFVGYRYYDKKKMDVLFPFGYGLSYTEFEYSDLHLSADHIKDTDTVTVTCKVKNVGDRAGKESVQLYVRDLTDTQIRPIRELKAFAKVELQPGAEKEIAFTLDRRAFSWYSEALDDFFAATGEYVIEIGKNSRDIVLEQSIHLTATVELPFVVDANTALVLLMNDPKTKEKAQELYEQYAFDRYIKVNRPITPAAHQSILNAPLRYFRRVCGWSDEKLHKCIAEFKEMLK